MRRLTLFAALLVLVGAAQAANYPCSGKKGGVAHCDGAIFVCNDGSISGSKKNCLAEMGPLAARGAAPAPKLSGGGPACTCRSHSYCTGPRGGRYCLSDSGAKSYARD